MADIWQVATVTLPECEVQAFGATRLIQGLCIFGFCPVCIGCAVGACNGVECPNSDCNLRTGRCIDPCEDVDCARGEVCNPVDRQCYPVGLGLCDACVFNDQCTAEGTDRCLNYADIDEHFCSRPCQQDNDCPARYGCYGLRDDGNVRYCAPEVATCIDRCVGVRCNGGEVCDPRTGACGAPPCELNTDCAAGEYCDRTAGSCQPTGGGAGVQDVACFADNECRVGFVCSLFACRRVCDVDANCVGGESCLPDIGNPGRLVCADLGG